MGVFGFLMRALKFRKEATTKERLQNIDDELEKLDTSLKRNRQRQKSLAVYLISISILLYCPSIVIFYLWYIPIQWVERLLYSIPFLIFPFLVFFLKKLLHHIFINRITSNASAVKELKKDKKKILETVMDTETYKVAKELLQKYDPNRSLVEESESPLKQTPKTTTEGQELRRRNIQSNMGSASKVTAAPSHSTSNGFPRSPAPSQRNPTVPMGSPLMRTPVAMIRGPAPRGPVPIAPILPRDRSVFDKVADYFIGDGPTNRFALICKQCYGHNGMVLVEEFEFTSYRCCYCRFFNPARKQRLNAPRLDSRKSVKKITPTESANSTDAESSNKGDDNDEKDDSNVEDNTLFEESDTKQIEVKKDHEEITDTTGDLQDDKDVTESDATDDGGSNDNNEKLETTQTDKTKEDR